MAYDRRAEVETYDEQTPTLQPYINPILLDNAQLSRNGKYLATAENDSGTIAVRSLDPAD